VAALAIRGPDMRLAFIWLVAMRGGCVAVPDRTAQVRACDAAYNAVVPTPLPSAEELAGKGRRMLALLWIA
jgi:hypothetical protein